MQTVAPLTLVTAIWKVRSWIGWLALLENVALSNIGPSPAGRFTSTTARRLESTTSISFALTADPGGRADVNAHSSPSSLVAAAEGGLCCGSLGLDRDINAVGWSIIAPCGCGEGGCDEGCCPAVFACIVDDNNGGPGISDAKS